MFRTFDLFQFSPSLLLNSVGAVWCPRSDALSLICIRAKGFLFFLLKKLKGCRHNRSQHLLLFKQFMEEKPPVFKWPTLHGIKKRSVYFTFFPNLKINKNKFHIRILHFLFQHMQLMMFYFHIWHFQISDGAVKGN